MKSLFFLHSFIPIESTRKRILVRGFDLKHWELNCFDQNVFYLLIYLIVIVKYRYLMAIDEKIQFFIVKLSYVIHFVFIWFIWYIWAFFFLLRMFPKVPQGTRKYHYKSYSFDCKNCDFYHFWYYDHDQEEYKHVLITNCYFALGQHFYTKRFFTFNRNIYFSDKLFSIFLFYPNLKPMFFGV